MREHKYRAWDKNLEFMIDPAFLSLDGNGLIAVFYENCDAEESLWETDPLILENIELLDYTGLKDKNGTEIYEGDILGAFYFVQDKLPVFFRNGAFAINNEQDGKAPQLLSEYLEAYPSKVEVIGNIYLNKDLIK